MDVRLKNRRHRRAGGRGEADAIIACVGADPWALPVPGASGENVVFGAGSNAQIPGSATR